MLQRVIFLCGPDMCGKTQIAKRLSDELCVPYFKASSEHSVYLDNKTQFVNQLRYADPRVADLLQQTGHSVIFDRGYPCEWVYSSVFKRQTDLEALRLLDEAYAAMNALIVICVRSTYDNIVDDLDPNIDSQKLEEISSAYMRFATWTKCDTLILNVDDENLEREVVAIILRLATRNMSSGEQ